MIKMVLIFWKKIQKLWDDADEARFRNTLFLHPSDTVVMLSLLISITTQAPSFPFDCCAPFPAYEVVSCILAKNTWTETDSSTAQQQQLQLWPKNNQGLWAITGSIQCFEGHVPPYGPFHCTDYTGEKTPLDAASPMPTRVDLGLQYI